MSLHGSLDAPIAASLRVSINRSNRRYRTGETEVEWRQVRNEVDENEFPERDRLIRECAAANFPQRAAFK